MTTTSNNTTSMEDPSTIKKSRSKTSSRSPSQKTSIHVTALDGVVNCNSLFTVAIFVGLSLTVPGQKSLENKNVCDANLGHAKRLLMFEVIAFSCFLFSSLIAQGLKIKLTILNSNDPHEASSADINPTLLRFGMLGSAIGSVMGCACLVFSMVNMIEIRLGIIPCGSKATLSAVATLVTLVSSALVFYSYTVVYAFTRPVVTKPSDEK